MLSIWRATLALISLAWKKLTIPLAPATVPARPISSMQTLDLLGSGWRLSSGDGKHCVNEAHLPANALQILHRAGRIEDPLAGCETVEALSTDEMIFIQSCHPGSVES